MRLLRTAVATPALALPLRLVLILILLRPMGPPFVGALLLALGVAGLLSTGVLMAPLTWLALSGLVTARLIADWPLPDNHVYLLAYFCAAIAIALLLPEEPEALTRSARLLLGLAFAFAVLWKAVLSGDYRDGRFFRVTLLTDDRFEDAVRRIGGLSESELIESRKFLEPLPEGAELLTPRRLHEPRGLRLLAAAATWGTLAIEGLIAIAFLWPGERLQPLRHGGLLLFCLVTYAFAPVAGFGWLLVAMGLSTCRPEERRARLTYLALFFLVLFYSEVPWAAVARGG